jgi:hypothetical protein
VIKSRNTKNAYQAITAGLEQGINERRYGGAFCQHQ